MEPVKNSNCISSTSNVFVPRYPKSIELLDESEHNDTLVLTKKLNEALKEINRLKGKL